ncbi:unnamed protein product [Vitrella brassicaformis CCMP3155]|uniref:Uncharacterized protein n=1 Tax=Vitrella brassicaformis (strain CCMP3155) TaxID=1169540 RepID=A0A0G4GKH2_VITBC|nr:unnamed protein product [Vitrella brassicaformis CCMP3155]|eukprot:CEM30505.1 unnamed protein product [Vitrella brassicaformis CCMP3155]
MTESQGVGGARLRGTHHAAAEKAYMTGLRHLCGEGGVPVCVKAAVRHLKESAQMGYAEASFVLAKLSKEGQCVDVEGYSTYLTRAASSGHGRALVELARVKQQGILGPKDPVTARQMLIRAADQDEASACPLLAKLDDAPQSLAARSKENSARQLERVRWLRRGADLGDPECLYALGCGYLEGTLGGSTVRDPAGGLEVLRKAAKVKHAEAFRRLGELYRDPPSELVGTIRRDCVHAAKLLAQGCDLMREERNKLLHDKDVKQWKLIETHQQHLALVQQQRSLHAIIAAWRDTTRRSKDALRRLVTRLHTSRRWRALVGWRAAMHPHRDGQMLAQTATPISALASVLADRLLKARRRVCAPVWESLRGRVAAGRTMKAAGILSRRVGWVFRRSLTTAWTRWNRFVQRANASAVATSSQRDVLEALQAQHKADHHRWLSTLASLKRRLDYEEQLNKHLDSLYKDATAQLMQVLRQPNAKPPRPQTVPKPTAAESSPPLAPLSISPDHPVQPAHHRTPPALPPLPPEAQSGVPPSLRMYRGDGSGGNRPAVTVSFPASSAPSEEGGGAGAGASDGLSGSPLAGGDDEVRQVDALLDRALQASLVRRLPHAVLSEIAPGDELSPHAPADASEAVREKEAAARPAMKTLSENGHLVGLRSASSSIMAQADEYSPSDTDTSHRPPPAHSSTHPPFASLLSRSPSGRPVNVPPLNLPIRLPTPPQQQPTDSRSATKGGGRMHGDHGRRDGSVVGASSHHSSEANDRVAAFLLRNYYSKKRSGVGGGGGGQPGRSLGRSASAFSLDGRRGGGGNGKVRW